MHDIKQEFFPGKVYGIYTGPAENADPCCRAKVYESALKLKILTAGVPFSGKLRLTTDEINSVFKFAKKTNGYGFAKKVNIYIFTVPNNIC